MANRVNVYQQNSVNTASPERLLIMLYEGLTKFIKQGIVCINTKEYSEANVNFIKAQNIIREFMVTLKPDFNKEVYDGLMALYDYMNRGLIEANINKDTAKATEILGMAVELKETFEKANILAKQK